MKRNNFIYIISLLLIIIYAIVDGMSDQIARSSDLWHWLKLVRHGSIFISALMFGIWATLVSNKWKHIYYICGLGLLVIIYWVIFELMFIIY